MTEYKVINATPSLVRFRVLRNSDISNLANSINGKGKVTPQPEFKPAPITITNVVEPEPVVEVTPEPVITPEEPVIEETVVEPAVEETVVEPTEEPTVVEPAVEETVVEETVVEEEVVEPETEETTEEVAQEGTDISVLNLSAANEKNLRSNNLTTVEALVAFTAENALESLPKIGNKAQEVILEALRKWQGEQSQN